MLAFKLRTSPKFPVSVSIKQVGDTEIVGDAVLMVGALVEGIVVGLPVGTCTLEGLCVGLSVGGTVGE